MKTAVTIGSAQLSWGLRDLMKREGIRNVRELHQRLVALDPQAVKYVRFTRIVRAMPSRLCTKTLLGLVIVLKCDIADLLIVREVDR